MQELRDYKLFKHLDDEKFQLLSTFVQKKHYTKGSVLFYEKDMPTSLTLLIEGVLKVYKTDLKNNEIIMHRFKPKAMIAEMAVLEGIPYPASAAFETDGTIIEINFEKFKNKFLSDKDIALEMFKSLSKKIIYLENVIALNVVLDSVPRLAKFICEHESELHTLKNYQLAEYLHMTPETLSRTFKKLFVLDLIYKDDSGYKIKNKKGLQVLFE